MSDERPEGEWRAIVPEVVLVGTDRPRIRSAEGPGGVTVAAGRRAVQRGRVIMNTEHEGGRLAHELGVSAVMGPASTAVIVKGAVLSVPRRERDDH